VDLLQANVEMVRRLFTAFGVPGKVVHAAASNELGTVYAPSVPTSSNRNDFYSPGKPGEERVQALPNAGPQRFTRFTRYNYTQRVPQLTVDALLREEAVHDVDLLTIDTEGHDALVLEGATETLAAQRVQVIEFEYSSGGRRASRITARSRRRSRGCIARGMSASGREQTATSHQRAVGFGATLSNSTSGPTSFACTSRGCYA
jgi:FkbM family methyltransferase